MQNTQDVREENIFSRDLFIYAVGLVAITLFLFWLSMAISFRPLSEVRYTNAVEHVTRYLTDYELLLDPRKHPNSYYTFPIKEPDPEDYTKVVLFKLEPDYVTTFFKGCQIELCVQIDKFYKVQVKYEKDKVLQRSNLILKWNAIDGYWSVHRDFNLW